MQFAGMKTTFMYFILMPCMGQLFFEVIKHAKRMLVIHQLKLGSLSFLSNMVQQTFQYDLSIGGLLIGPMIMGICYVPTGWRVCMQQTGTGFTLENQCVLIFVVDSSVVNTFITLLSS